MAWACEDWIEYAIEQALNLVDVLILVIGAFHPYFKKIEDKTYEKAKKYLNDKEIKFYHTIVDPQKNADQNRAATANYIFQDNDYFEIGDIIWILDVDEFYSKEAIEEIMNFIKNEDFDIITVNDRMFCINFDYYIISNTREF